MKRIIIFIVLTIVFVNITIAQPIKPINNKQSNINTNIKEIRSGGFNFINPLLDCYDIKSSSLSSNKILQLHLNEYIHTAISKKNAESVSVYYRDLNNGPWIGINENDVYSPASLLKVPYLLCALYQAQKDTSFLSRKVVCKYNASYYNEEITDGYKIIKGNTYTIEELLSAMIIHSSNIAKDMLMDNLTNDSYFEVFDELGIDIAKYDTITSVDFLSVKEYASFFRILYNSTFLNKQMSERALILLTKTTFVKGIVSGVPNSVIVSHKFGERFDYNSNLKQLHDCGIVYKSNHPYILCVMTKGKNYENMEKVINEISKLVYTHLEKKKSVY